MFFVDLLDNLPRLRLSDAHMEMVLWVMRQCGSQTVPSLKQLRGCQERLQKECGTPTLRHISTIGNIFYSNDIRATIAMVLPNTITVSVLTTALGLREAICRRISQ